MKTIEEKSRELGDKYFDDPHAIFDDGFKAGVEFAQQWISVEDELPSTLNGFINKMVLIKSQNGQVIEVAKYSSEKQKWLYTSISNRHPAHWRPIEIE